VLTQASGAVIYAAVTEANDFAADTDELGLRSRQNTGGMPEWLKGTDCKSVGSAYVGSNPTPSTILIFDRQATPAGIAQW
jgi:hypothetical protein